MASFYHPCNAILLDLEVKLVSGFVSHDAGNGDFTDTYLHQAYKRVQETSNDSQTHHDAQDISLLPLINNTLLESITC